MSLKNPNNTVLRAAMVAGVAAATAVNGVARMIEAVAEHERQRRQGELLAELMGVSFDELPAALEAERIQGIIDGMRNLNCDI
jgi:hypothetical protein